MEKSKAKKNTQPLYSIYLFSMQLILQNKNFYRKKMTKYFIEIVIKCMKNSEALSMKVGNTISRNIKTGGMGKKAI